MMYEAEVTILVEKYINEDVTDPKIKKETEQMLQYRLTQLLKNSDEKDWIDVINVKIKL